MKKKNLVIPVMLLSFALLSLPVMATPATRKENVTLTLETLLIADPDSAHWVDYNILHNEGISISNATLNREIQPDYTGPINNLYVTWNATTKFTSLIMPDPGARNIVKGEWVLTFTGEGATGTFEGVGHTKSIGLPPISLPGYCRVLVILRDKH